MPGIALYVIHTNSLNPHLEVKKWKLRKLSDLLKATWKPVFDPDILALEQMLGHSASLHKEALEEGGRGKSELLCGSKSGPLWAPGITSLGSRDSWWLWLP